MRRFFFWLGWALLLALPLVFLFEAFWIQDLPRVQLWKWAIPIVAVAIIAANRNRDDVLKHHVV